MHVRPRCAIFHISAFTASLSGVACAQIVPPDRGLSPERRTQLEQICTDTMQLSRGTTHFEDCVDVLRAAARKNDQPGAR